METFSANVSAHNKQTGMRIESRSASVNSPSLDRSFLHSGFLGLAPRGLAAVEIMTPISKDEHIGTHMRVHEQARRRRKVVEAGLTGVILEFERDGLQNTTFPPETCIM